MKVVLVNNLYTEVRGGAERSVRLLAEHLVRAGVAVTVICAAATEKATVDLNGVKVVTLGSGNVFWPFGGQEAAPVTRKLWHVIDLYNPVMGRRLAAVLEKEAADLVHTNNLQGISVSAWAAAKACGLPILHTLRDYYLVCARANRFRNGVRCARTCVECRLFCGVRRRAAGQVDAVVGTSEFIVAKHTQLGLFARAASRATIVNGCSTIAGARNNPGPLVFGFLGRLEAVKGVDVLLRAFAEREDEWKLLIAGVGPAAVVANLRRQADLARRPRQIRFLGWTDPDEFMRQVDVVVVPSLWDEPLARSAIDAQANGLALIAARRGGLPEIVTDGATGMLFEPDDPNGLARAVDRLLSEPGLARRLGETARAQASRFEPGQIATQYLQAYRTTIASRSRH